MQRQQKERPKSFEQFRMIWPTILSCRLKKDKFFKKASEVSKLVL